VLPPRHEPLAAGFPSLLAMHEHLTVVHQLLAVCSPVLALRHELLTMCFLSLPFAVLRLARCHRVRTRARRAMAALRGGCHAARSLSTAARVSRARMGEECFRVRLMAA
jgi:hypothetical protein